MATREELLEIVGSAIRELRMCDLEAPETEDLYSYLYQADQRIESLIAELKKLIQKGRGTTTERSRRGVLLEQIAFLAFKGLAGVSALESFQSAGPQYDLLVNGDTQLWIGTILPIFFLETQSRDILVECKALANKIGDKDIARLSAIIDTHLRKTGLGIFFTIEGATGTPKNPRQRGRSLRDARLRQVLHFARSRKPIVVLDLNDIERLAKNGSLVEIIVGKIRELHTLEVPSAVIASRPAKVKLPAHLAQLLE